MFQIIKIKSGKETVTIKIEENKYDNSLTFLNFQLMFGVTVVIGSSRTIFQFQAVMRMETIMMLIKDMSSCMELEEEEMKPRSRLGNLPRRSSSSFPKDSQLMLQRVEK